MSNFKRLLAQKEMHTGERYSQREIARLANVSTAVVSRWLNDEIEGANLATVKKLCDFLDCDIGDLLTMRGEKRPA